MALTINNELSTIRALLKEVTDDSKFTNSQLYALWRKKRATVLQNGRYKDFNRIRFCIALETAKSHNCDCVAVGCDVLKTVNPIPEYLQTPYHSSIKVRTLGGKLIGQTTDEALISEKTDPIKAGSIRWSLNSNYIVIWNNLDLKAIEVEAIWADPLAWDDIRLCPDEESGDCGEALEMPAGVTEEQSDTIVQLVIKELYRQKQIPDDRTADLNPER